MTDRPQPKIPGRPPTWEIKLERGTVGWWWQVTYHEGIGRSAPWGTWRPTRRGAERAARRSIARHQLKRRRRDEAERFEIPGKP